MVTKQDAVLAGETWGPVEFHYGECREVSGPRGGVTRDSETWRSNGHCKTWKSRPTDFRLPIKYGLYGYGYIDQSNAKDWHLASECVPVAYKLSHGHLVMTMRVVTA